MRLLLAAIVTIFSSCVAQQARGRVVHNSFFKLGRTFQTGACCACTP
jgi:hypothetical protein